MKTIRTGYCSATSEKNTDAGWSSPVARQAHNLKVVSSNLAPATKYTKANTATYAKSRVALASGTFACLTLCPSFGAGRGPVDVSGQSMLLAAFRCVAGGKAGGVKEQAIRLSAMTGTIIILLSYRRNAHALSRQPRWSCELCHQYVREGHRLYRAAMVPFRC